ncbi:MAG: 4-(cytidine 5'-diphospho)-2-C-methyl-D-erythritol kinase [Bacteroidota bacterium]|nr:4-(cytidine 5'-diphospho)-2-C-methyl-D-erythritol kinase [Bacteroidota bacterium]
MINFPNAKINIGLKITEKRKDGFHTIESIFYPIKLSDILEINFLKNGLLFNTTGIPIDKRNQDTNICIKAYHLLKNHCTLPSVHMHLHKNIPIGAGLGGGSSDAAFTLKMLNSMMKLNLSHEVLSKIAEETGSDCPFFILNKPSFATGKGNILYPVNLNLKGYFLVLIYPFININTASVYKKIKPQKSSEKLTDVINQPVETWKENIKNDFEKVIFNNYPEIKKIKDQLYNSGAVYASMSGSGSAVYGFFKEEVEIKTKFSQYFIWTEWL